MRKEKVLNSINARLTDPEYAEYLKLGGIAWFRLFLRHSAEMRATIELQKLSKPDRSKAKQNLRYHNTVPEGTTAVVASKWQPVQQIIQSKAR